MVTKVPYQPTDHKFIERRRDVAEDAHYEWYGRREDVHLLARASMALALIDHVLLQPDDVVFIRQGFQLGELTIYVGGIFAG